jgi:tRNA-Thr(GGU) m(6)t(6)A37 methyltransferase TsaA
LKGVHTLANLKFIGIVRNVKDSVSQIEIFPAFCDGLKGIAAFSHIIVLYWAHMRDSESERNTLLVFPRRHAANVETGVFACRSPSRPNPIGLCVVELVKVDECLLAVKGLDALQETPIIDIKPYIPRADSIPDAKTPEWTCHGPPT